MLNKVILMGRMVKDPELRHTNSGNAVASFSIAVNSGYGDEQKTDFINCVAWNKTAEFINNWFAKGRMIVLVGRLSTRTYESQDGRKNYVTEVIVNEATFGDSKKDDTEQENNGFIPVDNTGLPWESEQ